MSRRFVDVTDKFMNETDLEMHRTRCEFMSDRLRKQYESRIEKAKSMFQKGRYGGDVFKIAQVAKLPILTVRDIQRGAI